MAQSVSEMQLEFLKDKIVEGCLIDHQMNPEKMQAIFELLKSNNYPLIKLDISDSSIGTECLALAEALTINHTLTHLNISNCEINDKGVILLAEALQVNSTLISLNISNQKTYPAIPSYYFKPGYINSVNPNLLWKYETGQLHSCHSVSDKGIQALIKMLEINRTLTHLNISENGLSKEVQVQVDVLLKRREEFKKLKKD